MLHKMHLDFRMTPLTLTTHPVSSYLWNDLLYTSNQVLILLFDQHSKRSFLFVYRITVEICWQLILHELSGEKNQKTSSTQLPTW